MTEVSKVSLEYLEPGWKHEIKSSQFSEVEAFYVDNISCQFWGNPK